MRTKQTKPPLHNDHKVLISGIGGALLGYISTIFNGWEIIEPVAGISTLTITWYLSWQNRELQKQLGKNVIPKRTFEITFGLTQGKKCDGPIVPLDEIRSEIQNWLDLRIKNKQPFVTGILEKTDLIYPLKTESMDLIPQHEPGIIFYGSLSPHHDKDRNDIEVIQTLNSLANHLGSLLNDKRIYISFNDHQWTLETLTQKTPLL